MKQQPIKILFIDDTCEPRRLVFGHVNRDGKVVDLRPVQTLVEVRAEDYYGIKRMGLAITRADADFSRAWVVKSELIVSDRGPWAGVCQFVRQMSDDRAEFVTKVTARLLSSFSTGHGVEFGNFDLVFEVPFRRRQTPEELNAILRASSDRAEAEAREREARKELQKQLVDRVDNGEFARFAWAGGVPRRNCTRMRRFRGRHTADHDMLKHVRNWFVSSVNMDYFHYHSIMDRVRSTILEEDERLRIQRKQAWLAKQNS